MSRERCLHLDYSKNLIVDETMELLVRLAEEADVKGRARDMFSGVAINATEKRRGCCTRRCAPAGRAARRSAASPSIP